MTSENILLMGGGGNIGRAVCRFYNNSSLSKFKKIYLFDKKTIKKKLGKKIIYIKGNCLSYQDLDKLPVKIDVVLFLIGIIGGANSKKTNYIKKYFIQNSHSLFLFLEKIKKRKVKKIIFVSTEHVYGNNAKGFKLTDKKEPYPENYYGFSKILSEKILFSFYKKNPDLNIDILRIPRVIDYLGKNFISQMIKSALNKKIILLSNPNTKFNFIHINDILNAFNICANQNKTGFRILNIFNNNLPVSLKEIADKIKNSLNKKIKVFFKNTKDNYNPSNLKISNIFAKKELLWEPLLSTNQIIKKLINYYVSKKNIR